AIGIACPLPLHPGVGGALLGPRPRRFYCRDLGFELGEAVAVTQMLGGQGRTGVYLGETVPAPQPPLAIGPPRTRRQLRLQAAPGFLTLDPAGLSEAARECGRSSYGIAQREGAHRQARAALDPVEGYPETRSGWAFAIGKRRQQLVFEYRADRRLEAR